MSPGSDDDASARSAVSAWIGKRSLTPFSVEMSLGSDTMHLPGRPPALLDQQEKPDPFFSVVSRSRASR